MRAPRFLSLSVVLVSVVACSELPTQTALPEAPAIPAPAVAPAHVPDIAWETFQHQFGPNGMDEIATFYDMGGNHYRLEARYNHFGQLARVESYFNGTHVGSVNPRWSGGLLTEFRGQTDGVHWARIDGAAIYVIAHSGPGGDPNGFSLARIHPACPGALWLVYAGATLDMSASILAAGAVVAAPNPGTPFLMGVAASNLARATVGWYSAMRELDRCARPWRYS
jgi:hypothetical protein